MNDYNLRCKVLISCQRALLGSISTNIRAITIGYKNKKLKLIFYLNDKPNEEDYENISIVTTEIIADFKYPEDFNKIEEECIFSEALIKDLLLLDDWVYIRKE
jgi:hypothetical protein